MSASNKMTLRVQSPEGTARVEVSGGDATASLYEAVYEALRLSSFAFTLHRDRQHRDELVSSKSRLLRDCGLHHGDMLYLSPVNGALLFEQPSTSATTNNKPFGEPAEAGPSKASISKTIPQSSSTPAKPQEDDVDLELYKQNGKIQRQRDEKLCRHNSMGCCVHCSPLEPWDEDYLKEHNIKHMSFHAYLRKITSGKFISLQELNLSIKPGCKEHPAWPRGICSKCQPGAVTLTRQQYRHVDNVLIEDGALVERFLQYWRATGYQRAGWLYGRYEPHGPVPLGVRARVCALYEPAQESSAHHVALRGDARLALVDQLAAELGLRRVGWIFTDLLPDQQDPHLVQHLRGVDTHFLSAQECIMAGHLQNEHPNPCRYAADGYFGSKFVTVCVTGSASREVHLEGYQVSGQCQALVRHEALVPTRDAPELAYVRDSSDTVLVPDVYYKERDVYGNEVNVSAKRLPVAYLLVDVPVGEAAAGARTMFSPSASFPPANRPLLNHLQTLKALHQHIQQSENFLEAMSDLHVLVYLASNETLPLGVERLSPLLQALCRRDRAAADQWRADTPAMATLEALAAGPDAASSMDVPGGSEAGEVWTCPHCTYHNPPERDHCDMCALPRGNAM